MLQDLHDADVLLRAKRWLEELESSRTAPPVRNFDDERQHAFSSYFDGKRERSKNLCDALAAFETRLRGGNPALLLERVGAREELLAHTVETESEWGAFRRILAERASPAVGEPLQHADSCAWEIYATFLRAGLPAQPSTAALAPPTVTLGGVNGPLMFPRGGARNTDGAAWDLHEIPIPIIVLPAHEAAAVWAWTALAHEIGHVIDQKLDLAFTADGELHRSMAAAPLVQRADWAGWLREIVADALGLLLGGEGFAWTLTLLVDRLRQWRHGPSDDLYHPPPVIRAQLLDRWLEVRGAGEALRGQLSEIASAGRGKKEVAPDHSREARIVADVVLRSSLCALGDKSLESIAPDASADRKSTAALLAFLTGDSEMNDEVRSAPRRLIPGAAQLALVSVSPVSQAALESVRERAFRVLVAAGRPDWLTPPRDFEFLRTEAREHKATTLDERTGRKIPPANLFAAHERLSFVGAANDQLADALQVAFELRKERLPHAPRWTEIEVFFLSPPALQWMAVTRRDAAPDASPEPSLCRVVADARTPERTREALEKARERAIADLSRRLPEVAVRWTLLEYDAPFYFASYCDPEGPGGRIHISPAIWGKDIRDCPADDYVRGQEAPSPKYRAYLDGLVELRKKARPIPCGGREPSKGRDEHASGAVGST